MDNAVGPAVGDDNRDVCGGGFAGGHEFGFHPAGGEFPVLSFIKGKDVFGYPFDKRNTLPAVVFESVGGGKQNQDVGFDEDGHQRGKQVVVAEFNFFGGDGVVFVNDRHNPIGDQIQQRVLSVDAAFVVLKDVIGEQNLTDFDVLQAEKMTVETHQTGLPDGGGHLEIGQGVGTFFDAERFDAGGDGPGGDENHFAVVAVALRDAGNQRSNTFMIRLAGGVHQHAAADFDNDPTGLFEFVACLFHKKRSIIVTPELNIQQQITFRKRAGFARLRAMRINSGILGRRTFKVPKDGLRPTMDRTREAVFSSLAARVPGARVLDLFAGAGGYALEAWSRGAASVTAVEKVSKHWKILRENFQTLEGYPELGRWETVQADVYDYLKRAAGIFDLVFADPPYDEADLPKLLDAVCSALAADGILVFELRSHGNSEIPPRWILLKEKIYGEAKILFLQKVEK